jgi:hypothetical protein
MWPASVPANTSSSSTKQTTALPLRQPDWQLLPLLLQIPARLLLQLVRNRRIRQSESLKRAAQAQAAEHARSDEHEIVETAFSLLENCKRLPKYYVRTLTRFT